MSPTVVPERIAELLDTAPGWCRVGLTAPSERLRERATQELAAIIAIGLDRPDGPSPDRRQLVLPLEDLQLLYAVQGMAAAPSLNTALPS